MRTLCGLTNFPSGAQGSRTGKCHFSNTTSLSLRRKLRPNLWISLKKSQSNQSLVHSIRGKYGDRLRPVDLIRIALLGNNETDRRERKPLEGSSESYLWELLRLSRKKPPYAQLLKALVRKDAGKIICMSGVQLLRSAPKNDRMNLGERRARGLRLAKSFDQARTLRDVLRAVMSAVETHQGQRQLLIHQLKLVAVLYRFWDNYKGYALLSTLNAIADAFRRRSLPLGKQLCMLGMDLSARLPILPAMQRYLLEYQWYKYDISTGAWKHILKQLILRSGPTAEPDETRFGLWRRRDTLRLLTGWRVAGLGAYQEKQGPSLASCLPLKNPVIVTAYVNALVQLGACGTICQFWSQVHQGMMTRAAASKCSEAKFSESKRKRMALIVIQALAKAGDADQAIRLILENNLATNPEIHLSLLRDLCRGVWPGHAHLRILLAQRLHRFVQVRDTPLLKQVELSLGVRWVKATGRVEGDGGGEGGGDGGVVQGYHVREERLS